jgi:hypothetical protein
MLNVTLALSLMLLAPEPRVPIVAVSASSAKAEGPAALATDGKAETSWRPDAEGAFGLGQWIRLDLGRVVDVTAFDIVNGVQRLDGGVDQFCQYGRASMLRVYSDTGSVNIWPEDAYGRSFAAKVGSPGFQKPIRTRYLTFVIDGVTTGFRERGTPGIAEIAISGTPAPDHPAESGPVTCGSRRLAQIRDAIIEHCSSRYRDTRPTAECILMRSQLDFCAGEPPRFLPIPEKDFESGALKLSLKSKNPPFPQLSLSAERGPNEHWAVSSLTCERGKKACGLRHTVSSDGSREDLEVTTPKLCQNTDGTFVRAP